MAITFQCKRSGNFLVVSQVDDIVKMRQHEGYVEVPKNSATMATEVIEKPAEVLPDFLTPTVQTESRRGRPRKAK